MTDDLVALLEKVKSTADFTYVDFNDVNATNSWSENALHVVAFWGDLPFTIARLHGNDENCEVVSAYLKGLASNHAPSPAQKHIAALSGEIEALEKKINEECE